MSQSSTPEPSASASDPGEHGDAGRRPSDPRVRPGNPSGEEAREVVVRRYELPVYPGLDPQDTPFYAQDYTLAYALGLEDNYQAEKVVQAATATHPATAPHGYRFYSEMGCFFAYADTRAAIDALVQCVADLVMAGPHPNAVPGGMLDSPATIRTWDVAELDESTG